MVDWSIGRSARLTVGSRNHSGLQSLQITFYQGLQALHVCRRVNAGWLMARRLEKWCTSTGLNGNEPNIRGKQYLATCGARCCSSNVDQHSSISAPACNSVEHGEIILLLTVLIIWYRSRSLSSVLHCRRWGPAIQHQLMSWLCPHTRHEHIVIPGFRRCMCATW